MSINNGQPVAAASFGEAVDQYRILSGLSLKELSSRVDRSHVWLKEIESNTYQLKIATAEVLTDALALSEEQSKQLIYLAYCSIKQIPFYQSASQEDDYKLITLVADWPKLTQEERNTICQTITQVVSC